MIFSQEQSIWEKIQRGPFIIAEAGKNFIQTEQEKSVAEYLQNAKQLVDEAVKAGADAIKFQTHNVEDEQLNINIVSPHFKGADRYRWVSRNTESTPINNFWRLLKEYCDKKGITFFSTPMSRGAAKILGEVGVNLWKIGSGDILDFVMLDYIRQSGKPIIISSGMSTVEEIDKAIEFLKRRTDKIVLLHCISRYPCPVEDLNLKTIEFFQKRYNLPIGFSDHSIGCDSAVAATNLGAKIIEKHFSLSRDLWGADHKVSLRPDEFTEMVKNIRDGRQIELGEYGKEAKILQEDETVFRPIFRKSLMAGQDIKNGTVLTEEMIYAMRPQQYAGGLPSERYEEVIGKKVNKDFKKYEAITEEMLI